MAAKKTALGAKFREYTSLRYGVTIQVYVDTRGWFSAEAFNETIHKATYAEVCQRIDELAAMFERLEWHFVMDVTLERYHTDPLAYRKIEARDFHPVDFLTSAGVRFEARRYYLGRRADKT